MIVGSLSEQTSKRAVPKITHSHSLQQLLSHYYYYYYYYYCCCCCYYYYHYFAHLKGLPMMNLVELTTRTFSRR